MEKYIEGHYSKISYKILDEFEDMPHASFLFEWEKVGSNDSSSPDREIIARYICDTPDITHDFKTSHLEDIFKQWVLCSDVSVRIAKCFLAGKNAPENPIYKDLAENLIDEWEHDLIWLRADFYENWWKIINIKWKKIKSALDANWSDCNFKNPVELMQMIIDEHLTKPFIHWTSQKFKQFSQTRDKKMWKLLRESHRSELSNTKLKALNRLLAEHSRNIWTERLTHICSLLSEKGDFYIKARLQLHYEICDGIAKQNLKTYCDPTLRHHRNNSYNWVDGCWKPLN